MPNDMPKEVDYTMLSTFLRCRKRYYWRIVRGIVGRAPQTAPEFGRCIHKALDNWFKFHNKEQATLEFLTSFKENPADEKRTNAVAKKLLDLYFEKYDHEGFKVLQSEIPFTVPIPDTDKALMGRIDKIIEWDGAVYVMDHKTTSRLGYEFFYKIKPNMQFDGYIWAARQLGYPTCSGILLDALLVAKGLTIPSQLARLQPLARDLSVRTDDDLKRYITNVKSIIEDMYICYQTDDWYENTESCCDFIECPYRKICKEDPEIHERIIEMDYQIERWDPRKGVTNAVV